jgi:DNA-binding transcriptional MerR regulator
MQDKPLTKREAAEFYRCSERTIDRYRALGLIKAAKFPGRVLFERAQLEKALGRHMEK